MSDFVGGEEEDARVIFKDTKEDGDDAVPAHVLAVAGLEKDIGFIELSRWYVSTAACTDGTSFWKWWHSRGSLE